MEPLWSPPPDIEEFHLERRLGGGANGDVWLAQDTLLDRAVALKIATETLGASLRARFRIEARAVARLQHPNVLAVHHVGEVDAHPFLVTELLSGKSLEALPLPLDPARVLAIGIDLSRGLAAAHRAGVLHRDVKPANAFLCDDGVAKLLDFGLAKLTDAPLSLAESWSHPSPSASPSVPSSGGSPPGSLDATQVDATISGGFAGTPLYMAPETWRGEVATPRTDVYSLGALLFELLAGEPPCVANQLAELRKRTLAGRIGDLRALAPATPAGLVDLVLRCVRVAPGERPTAEELCDALAGLVSLPVSILAEALDDPAQNPYRGLLAFEPEHRALFFGREAETAGVIAELRANPFVLVAGASGAGKSSLARAGVVPRVENGALGGGGPWRAVVVVPGRRPLQALARAVGPVLGIREADAVARLTGSAEWLADELRAARTRLLLVIDQLEEIWTLTPAEERATFFEVIAGVTRSAPTARVLATLRADFLGRLEDVGELQAPALRALTLLRPLNADGLCRAIVEPALRRGVTIEPVLVERLVAGAEGGSLPLLEFALRELYARRAAGAISIGVSELDALGGVEGALAAHADAALAQMPEARRRDARRLLLALVTGERTRARREESDLLVAGSEEARAALAALVEARLVVANAGERGATYEVAHEALLSGWPALRAWLDEEAATLQAADRVRRAAAEWERLGRVDEALFGAAQLGRLGALGRATLAPREEAFLSASRVAVKRARRRRMALWIGGPLLLASIVAAFWLVTARRHRAAVARAVDDARALDARAEVTGRAAEDLRARAFALFEKDDVAAAEKLWKEMLAREDAADGERRDVSAALDRALSLDPRSVAARGLDADVTLARLLAAERLHHAALLGSLRARLALYDDGSRAATLEAGGRVRFASDPPGAALTLARYRADASGRLSETDLAPLEAGAPRPLEPGSYVVHAALAERYPTVYPFVVRRGESLDLRIVLPRASDIPRGMLYVPAGRSQYGSGDDEATRIDFLTHQPIHDVEVGAFLVGRTEVTCGEYFSFFKQLPAGEQPERAPGNISVGPDGRVTARIRRQIVHEGEPFCIPGQPCVELESLPMAAVSRHDAEAYAKWLSTSGRLRGARLCTDREWERVARGADDRGFPRGDEPGADDACTGVTYMDRRAGPPRSCPVGTHPASQSLFGAQDITGNAWEWVAGAADVAQPDSAISRGGSWREEGLYLLLANRGLWTASDRYDHLGFRVCADAP